MDKEQIKLEDLPQATSELKSEVKALRASVELLASKLDLPTSKDEDDELIGVDEACRILGLKKPTVYHKAQRKEIKSYKPSGCKKLMFKRSDLQKWILSSGRVIDSETILKEIQSGVRHKPRSITEK